MLENLVGPRHLPRARPLDHARDAHRPRAWRSAAGPGAVSAAGVQLGHHPPGALAVERRFVGDTLVLAISGELDLATRDLLRDALAQIDDEPPPRLVVDLRGLVFIDVSGLSLLQSLATRCRTRGQVLELIPGPAPVHEAFAITGLADRLPFTGSCTQRRVAEYPQPDPASSPFADPLLALLL